MARRTKGEGGIYQRKKDGLWIGVLYLGKDATGRVIRKYVSGDSKTETAQRLAAARAKIKSGIVDVERYTVREYLEKWLQDTVRGSVRPNTFAAYQLVLKHHVIPAIGHERLSRLVADHIQGMLGIMERKGRSARLRKMAFEVLRIALNLAVKRRLIAHSPAIGVVPPVPEPKKPKVLDPNQSERLLKAAQSNPAPYLYPFLLLDISTGARHGELLGLTWDCINEERCEITIEKTLIEIDSKILGLAPLKSKRQPTRTLAISRQVLAVLKAHRVRMAQAFLKKGMRNIEWVFPNADGNNLLQGNVRRAFRQALAAAGLDEKMRIHDLRHSNATLLLMLGESPKVVQERLGHSNISVTLGTYSHVLKEVDRAAADKLGNLLDSEGQGQGRA